MPVSVTMPRLGESESEGAVTRWLKREGERVEADEPLLEVSTDKVDTEIPAPAAGVLTAIKVGEDETVEVGVELAVIDESGAAASASQAAPPAEQAEAAPSAPQQAPAQPQQPPAQWRQPAQPQAQPQPQQLDGVPAPAAPRPSDGP